MAVVLREVSAVQCGKGGVAYVIEGSEEIREHQGQALLVRGRVFHDDEAWS